MCTNPKRKWWEMRDLRSVQGKRSWGLEEGRRGEAKMSKSECGPKYYQNIRGSVQEVRVKRIGFGIGIVVAILNYELHMPYVSRLRVWCEWRNTSQHWAWKANPQVGCDKPPQQLGSPKTLDCAKDV